MMLEQRRTVNATTRIKCQQTCVKQRGTFGFDIEICNWSTMATLSVVQLSIGTVVGLPQAGCLAEIEEEVS